MKVISFVVVVIGMITGCTVLQMEEEKVANLQYIIVKEAQLPQEVQILIEANCANEMKMSYTDQGIEYIIIGYGAQETSGYSIEVVEVYETDNSIHVNTNLIGPMSGEEIVELTTYPYIVISIEESAKPVIYE